MGVTPGEYVWYDPTADELLLLSIEGYPWTKWQWVKTSSYNLTPLTGIGFYQKLFYIGELT